MSETATKDRVEMQVAQPVPEAQLPAVHQEPRPVRAATPPKEFPARIAKAILAVTREIGVIQKLGVNQFQHYKFTKWDDINDKLSPLLADNGIIIVQSEQSRNLLEENDKGSVLAIVYHFTIINEFGEQWPPVEWTAIARLRDSKGVTDDKAALKCHTSAEKSYCVKQFKIRVDENVLDEGKDRNTLPKKDARAAFTKLQDEINSLSTVVEGALWGQNVENIKRKEQQPPDWQDILAALYRDKMAELRAGEPKVEWTEDGEITNPPAASGDAPAPASPQTQVKGAGALSSMRQP